MCKTLSTNFPSPDPTVDTGTKDGESYSLCPKNASSLIGRLLTNTQWHTGLYSNKSVSDNNAIGLGQKDGYLIKTPQRKGGLLGLTLLEASLLPGRGKMGHHGGKLWDGKGAQFPEA